MLQIHVQISNACYLYNLVLQIISKIQLYKLSVQSTSKKTINSCISVVSVLHIRAQTCALSIVQLIIIAILLPVCVCECVRKGVCVLECVCVSVCVCSNVFAC